MAESKGKENQAEGQVVEGEKQNEMDVFELVDEIQELGVLRELRQLIDGKIEELREKNAKPWKKVSFKLFWNKTTEDIQALILQLAENGGELTKEEIESKMGIENSMKLTGMLAGISRKARNMGYADLISREQRKDDNGVYHTYYKLDENVHKFVKEL